MQSEFCKLFKVILKKSWKSLHFTDKKADKDKKYGGFLIQE